MTIVHDPIPAHLPEDERICFYCFRPLTPPYVMWMGSIGAVSLHPPCAVEMTIRLLRDVHEVECRTKRYVTGPRSLEELRGQLIAEEHRA